jgi:hypothetical protein
MLLININNFFNFDVAKVFVSLFELLGRIKIRIQNQLRRLNSINHWSVVFIKLKKLLILISNIIYVCIKKGQILPNATWNVWNINILTFANFNLRKHESNHNIYLFTYQDILVHFISVCAKQNPLKFEPKIIYKRVK